jgi:alkylated DNA repair dioxygenase AlkB
MTDPIYIAAFVDRDIADQEFHRLWNNLDWERRADAPRREYWQNNYGVPYTYGRGAGQRTYEARPWDGMVQAWMERLNHEHGFELDCCFINGYETKRDSLGWHADDSPEMRRDQPVISLSLGGERDIEVKENATGEKQRFRLGHGSVFIMPAGFQQTHEHRIPKAGYDVPPRISLTYRGLDLAVLGLAA